MKARVENRLAQIRKSRGVGASDLARRVNVSRQTIYAIEAGTYVPNTEVALNLARELEVTVDELFSLQAADLKSPGSLATGSTGGGSVTRGNTGSAVVVVVPTFPFPPLLSFRPRRAMVALWPKGAANVKGRKRG